MDPGQMRRLLDDFPLGVIITDTSGIVVYYNKAHSHIDGITQEEMLGRRWIESLIPLNGPNIMYVCQRMAKPILGYVYSYKTYKGRVVNAAYWVYPIMDDGEVTGAVCFTQPLLSKPAAHGRAPGKAALQWPGYIPISESTLRIVGNNADFLKATGLVKSNAINGSPILISGETGSGKELLARLVHQSSPRRGGPYLSVKLSAIPVGLVEGLLFGTAKGSFTGAVARPGMLTEAKGGTLYLDELDSLPPELQPKLLAAVRGMSASRIGSTAKEALDFKLVVSVGANPREAMDSGRLRPDLFAQVSAVLVDIPPLRKRLDDLQPLADFFMAKYNALLGKQALSVDRLLWEPMLKYSWPGNVRELEQLLAVAIAQISKLDTIIGLKHVQDHYAHAFALIEASERDQEGQPGGAEAAIPGGEDSEASYLARLAAEERRLKGLLGESAGNVARAARKLGISRQLLNHRLKKYGIDPKNYR
jgi:arginine utilization regulatory protein